MPLIGYTLLESGILIPMQLDMKSIDKHTWPNNQKKTNAQILVIQASTSKQMRCSQDVKVSYILLKSLYIGAEKRLALAILTIVQGSLLFVRRTPQAVI